MFQLYAEMPTTIFEIMSGRARASGAINLGQGFPDGGWPEDVVAAAARALTEQSNQYPPMAGLPALRAAVADHYRVHQGVALTPDEVIVTSGATEAIAAAILALVSPGDEVLMFQPLYDAYLPLVRRAGGVPKFVNLQPPHWQRDPDELAAAFSDRTRVVILNNPLNPTASMASRAALEQLGALAEQHDALIIADEVWEHVVFDGARHCSVLAVPALRERSVKIGSAGKIFALTGWKIGWLCAAPRLAQVMARAHQFLTFTTPPNLQVAVAEGLAKEAAWFDAMRAGFARSRNRLVGGLTTAGYSLLPAEATWFVSIDLPASGVHADDRTVAEALLNEGVASIPVSAFYAEAPVTTTLRLCFAKADAVLDAAVARMAAALPRLQALA